jgi:polar amino acid transport system substrate-binding protein
MRSQIPTTPTRHRRSLTIMAADIASEIAKGGTLRAAINLGNPLLVTGSTPAGEPIGVAPDLARAIADKLGAAISYVTFASPGEVADAIKDDGWDICLIAAEPKRAETIAFTPAYVEIEATYLVAAGSAFRSADDVDRPGVRIAVSGRSAYDLYLSRTLKHGELHRAKGLAGALELFVAEKLDALAGLRPALNDNAANLPGARVLDGRFTSVQQAIGTRPENSAAQAFLDAFVAEAKANGLIASLLKKHGVEGRLQVASDR